jgi:esterase/lipase superfamily enzyme
MNREYHKWYSPNLGREMELLVFGHAGNPVVVFPTSMGRFYDYEDRNMIRLIGGHYENGWTQTFCVDSVDKESWYNKQVHPAVRAARHNQYDAYMYQEVIPFIQARNPNPITVTGCSFGGYHTLNFALRHPDVVSRAVSMSGAFDVHQFSNGHYDEGFYFNCPPDFLPGLSDPWYLERYRRMHLVLGVGEHDICLADNVRMAEILDRKNIPHELDIWGGYPHDWPLWEQMVLKFF